MSDSPDDSERPGDFVPMSEADLLVFDALWSGVVNDWAADDLQGRTSSELVADLVAGARVVKAANTLGAEVLGSDPQEAGGRRVISTSATTPTRRPKSWHSLRPRVRPDRPRVPWTLAERCSRSTDLLPAPA